MRTKVYSTIGTVSWLLGMVGVLIACGAFALVAFVRGSIATGIILVVVALANAFIATRARFPDETELEAGAASSVHTVGGPAFYLCLLKLRGKWCWFLIGPASKATFARVFAVDV
jgi:hypothetical protein